MIPNFSNLLSLASTLSFNMKGIVWALQNLGQDLLWTLNLTFIPCKVPNHFLRFPLIVVIL